MFFIIFIPLLQSAPIILKLIIFIFLSIKIFFSKSLSLPYNTSIKKHYVKNMGILSQIKDIEIIANLCYKNNGDKNEKSNYFSYNFFSWMFKS